MITGMQLLDGFHLRGAAQHDPQKSGDLETVNTKQNLTDTNFVYFKILNTLTKVGQLLYMTTFDII